jgi:hypothetical protein
MLAKHPVVAIATHRVKEYSGERRFEPRTLIMEFLKMGNPKSIYQKIVLQVVASI